jgi:hypothetical protein
MQKKIRNKVKKLEKI